MFERANREDINNKSETISNHFSTNPINSKSNSNISDKITRINSMLAESKNLEVRHKKISEIVDYIYSLTVQDIASLMTHKNEIVRDISSRAFVDKEPEQLAESLKLMLSDSNEFIRAASVSSLCYLNSPEYLDLLEKATQDKSDSIKLRALTGIADIAAEHSNDRAKNILKGFLNSENREIREFVSDELSILL